MTAATLTVYPGLNSAGTSLTVYAEDEVTLIPASGAIVPYAEYYTTLLANGRLRTDDPLALSGDPITIPAVTRVSAGLSPLVTTGLSSRPALVDGEQVATSGYADEADGGGATFVARLGVSAGNNPYTRINASNCQWEMIADNAYRPEMFGAVGDGDFTAKTGTDDTAALHACFDYAQADNKRVRLLAVFAGRDIVLRPGVVIEGDGRFTGFLGLSGYIYVIGYGYGTVGTSDVDQNERGFTLRNLRVMGRVEDNNPLAYDEHVHNIFLSAVTDVLVEDVWSDDSRADGIYLGSGSLGGEFAVERHNKNVTLIRFSADGGGFPIPEGEEVAPVGGDNRNGISVIDCENLRIDDFLCTNHTRPNMPGGLDMEPDHTYNVVRNVAIRRPVFKNVGGNVGTVSGVFRYENSEMVEPVNSITVEDADIQGCRHGVVFLTPSTSVPHNISISRTRAKEGEGIPLGLYGVNTVVVDGGKFSEWDNSAIIGYTDAVNAPVNVTFRNLAFHRCGRVAAIGASIFYAEGVSFDRVTFDDCGASDATGGDAIKLHSGGGAVASSRIRMRHVRVIPGTRTTAAINQHAAHVTDAFSNEVETCDWGGVPSVFAACKSDDETKVGSYSTASPPDSFPAGWSTTAVNNSVTTDAGAPDAFKQGVLVTYRARVDTGYRKFTFQEYYPAENTVRTRVARYFRHADSASNTWLPWSIEGAQVEVSSTVDPTSIATGASYTSAAVSYPGAEFGDFIEASCERDLQGLSLTAYVSAADAVKFVLSNGTGGPVDLVSSTFYLKARKRAA